MATPLRCLLVEDSESDVRLIVRALKKAGYEVVHERVETAGEMRDALKERVWDAVIADYTLPEFGGPAALTLLREIGLDLPFIVVSGTIGEKAAVAMMRAGAHDYLLKGDLSRLGPAVERELGAAEARREHRRAEDALRESEKRFRDVVEGAPEGVFVQTEGCFRYLNPAAIALFGAASADQLLDQPVIQRFHPDYHAVTAERIHQLNEERIAVPLLSEKWLRLDGTVFDVEVSAVPFTYGGENGALVFFRDITERKRAEEVQVFLARTSSGTANESFFNALARYLADSLPVDFVCIDRLEGDELTARTVAVWCDGHFEDNVTYALKDTPCGDVVGKTICCFPKDVRHLFPQDTVLQEMMAESYVGTTLWSFDGKPIGLIAVIGRRPLLNPQLAESVLQLVAVRAAGELERQQAEETLRASEARYRLIADNTSDVIWTLDLPSNRITYVSPSVRRLRGYSPEEVLAQSLEGIMTPESYRHATTLLAERTAALESGDESARTAVVELDHTCKDGSIVATELVATLLTDALGHVTGVVGVSRDITQRKRAEAALRQIEERARLLADMLERSSQPFATANPDGRMGMVNAAYCNLVGYSQDELRTLNWVTDLTALEWREVTPASLAELNIKGDPVRYEKEYVRKNGSRVPVEVLANLVRDSTGAPSSYYAFVTDLTERRQAHQALQQSEQRYRELFENSQFGVYRSTPDGRILLVNPALLTMLGYSSMEELAKRNLEEEGFEPEYDRGWFKDTLERDGRIRDHEAQWTRRDGNPVHVIESAIAVRDANGAVLHYDGTVEDITERRRTADALRNSEERFRQVAEDAGVFVWEVDPDGLYTYASPVVQEILGYAPNELIGKVHHYDLFAPDDREELKAIATEAFAQRRSFSSFLNANVRKDGMSVILETNGVPLLDAAGNLLGYRGTARDVTDRARATEELRKHRDHLEELVKERTAELARQNERLADEVFAHSLVIEALKRSKAHLHLQMDCMPIACITLGPDSRIRSWNPAAEQVFGYSSEEAIGALVLDLLVPEDIRTEVETLIEKSSSGDQTFQGVNDNLTKDGRRIIGAWTNTPLVDSDSGGVGLLCMVQDITASRKAEEALRVRTRELEAFNKAMIGREKRSIELKEEINRLCAELGRPPAYPAIWSGDKQ